MEFFPKINKRASPFIRDIRVAQKAAKVQLVKVAVIAFIK